jgi:succinate dehydrogenase / fumarate reductase, cytochrome b subunit
MPQRPLSPHLQIYRLPFTAVLSILHRVTGVLLTCGMAAGVIGLLAFAEDADRFPAIHSALDSALGTALLWAWLYSLFLHACHGLRHLLWDAGLGFHKAGLDRNARRELLGSVLLTVACYLLASHGI